MTVRVGEWEADIDVAIAPLIRELWRADMLTVMSCQGDPGGTVWVCFASAEDLHAFLSVVAAFEPGIDTLYNRICCEALPPEDAPPVHYWEYDIRPIDFALDIDFTADGVHKAHAGACDFAFNVSVRFPASDLPVLLARLRAHNGTPDDEPGSA